MGHVARSPPTTTVLLADADVLIDYRESDLAILDDRVLDRFNRALTGRSRQ